MKIWKFLAAPAVIIAGLVIAFTASAYYPTMSISTSGSSTTIYISGAQSYSSVVINYTPSGSSLSGNVTGTTDGSGAFTTMISNVNSSSITATVGGQAVYQNGNGGCTYNCGNPYNGNLSLSQTSVSLSVGQSVVVTSYNGGTLYVSSNSNSGVASYNISGSQITIYGTSAGSTTLDVCTYNSGCTNLYVTVNGSNNCGYSGSYNCVGGMTLSPSSLSLNSGQSSTVYVSFPYINNSQVYLSSNSNSSVATAAISGSTITVYGSSAGSTTMSFCVSGNGQCASLYVTVNGSCYSGNCSGNFSLAQTSVNMNIGQNTTVATYNSNGSLYISSNSNSSVVSVSITGSSIYLYANSAGSSTISICSSNSNCASLYVTVGGSGSGSVWFSPSSPTMYVGQSLAVSINSSASNGAYGYNSSYYYISSNSNSGVVSASVSGTVLNLYANSSGSSTLTVCANSLSFCGTLYVTVSGGSYGNNGVWFSPTSVNLYSGQSQYVSISSNNGYSNSYYISSNSNSGVVSASVSGSNLYLIGNSNGNSTIMVCQSGYSNCGSLYVTVGGGNSGYGNLTFSQTNVNVNVGQNVYVTAYGSNGSLYISSNSNSSAASASVSGNSINIYGSNYGSTSLVVCQSGYTNNCGTIYVTVGNGNGGCTYNCGNNGTLIFVTTTLPTITVNQNYSQQLQVTGGTSPYYFTLVSGSLPAGLSLSQNGLISGYSQNSNPVSFTVRVTDTYGSVTAATFSIGGGGVLGSSIFSNGVLISENGTVYIVYRGTKSGFANAAAFTGFGFSFANVIPVNNSGLTLSSYTITTSRAAHPWGSWIKIGGTVYFVQEAGLIPVPNWNTFIANGGQANLIVTANSYDYSLPILTPMAANDYRLQ